MTLSAWPALILAAGYGTRARPLTFQRAKAAFPMGRVSLVERLLAWLARSGVQDVVINLHHRPETITRLVGDGRQFNLRVRYSFEPTILGSAGGPAHAMRLSDAPRWLIINGDTLTEMDLAALTARHLASGALVTLSLIPNPAPHRYGGVYADDHDRVVRFGRPIRAGADAADPAGLQSKTRPTYEGDSLHFIGVQAVERSVFADVAIDRTSESVGDLFPRLIDAKLGSVSAHVVADTFHDIGTPTEYFNSARAMARADDSGMVIGRGVQVADDAEVTDSVMWDGVVVGRGASIHRSVIADNVNLPAGSTFNDCVVLPASDVPEDFTATRADTLAICGLDPGRPPRWRIGA